MDRATELRNEAKELLAKALKAREADDAEAFKGFWAEYEAKDKEATATEAEEAKLKAAMEKYEGIDPAEVRNPEDALLKGQDPATAKSGVLVRKDGTLGDSIGNFEVLPFASKDQEGWVKGLPAACQLPGIVRRLAPKEMTEAEAYRKAFWTYARHGKDGVRALDEMHRKALQEGVDAEGGFFVPTDQVRLPVILARGVPGGVTRGISSVFTTSRDSGDWPASTDAVTWAAVAEEASFGASDPTISQVPFTIRKIGRINQVSAELLEDSAVNLPALLSQLFVNGLGRYEDQQAVEGDGTTEPLGLRTTGATQGNIADITDLLTLAGPTVVELLAAFYELPAQWRANASWHTTSSFMGLIAATNSTGAGIHVFQELMGTEPVPRLMGRPIVFFDGTGWDNGAAVAANEEVGAIGDFSLYYFVDRIGMSITRLDERYADTDQVGFKARKRYDSFFAENDAFRIIKGAAS